MRKDTIPSSSSWLGFGTSFRTVRISSFEARFLMAFPTDVATTYPGKEPAAENDGAGGHVTHYSTPSFT